MAYFRSEGPKRRQPRTLALSVLIFVLIFAVFLLSLSSMSESTARRQRESLEKALDRSVAYCYAIEGSYPESLSYIKANYGLSYDEERFFVDYVYQGGNMLPDITIIERGEG